MARRMVSVQVSDPSVIRKDLVSVTPPDSPASHATSQSLSSTIPAGNRSHQKQRNHLTRHQHHQQQQHHRHQVVTVQTFPRTSPQKSLGDDIESVSGATSMIASSPPRGSSTEAVLSPKLSPISHASSTARQQERRQRRHDEREPPSPQKLSRQQQQQPQQKAEDGNASSSDTPSPKVKVQLQESSTSTTPPRSITSLVDEDDFVDLSDLFQFCQERDWEKVYDFLKQHPNASRQTIHSKKGITPLLHIVLRHGPPLPIVDLLLTHMEQADKIGGKASSSSSSSSSSSVSGIWKQFDTNGRLPLHAACSCGPEAGLDVISKLISADPEALQIRTKDQHGRYPLHIAVVTDATEDVVMELMINFPEASFRPDLHGKIPIEYAQESVHGHNRLVVALEWAPMFMAATTAAYMRMSKVTDAKLKSLREAHASYEEQLEERTTMEKMALVQDQIQCSNALANEKERNIALAEAMLAMKASEKELIKDKDVLQSKLDRELLIRKTRNKLRDDELKQILLGKQQQETKNQGGRGEKQEGGDEQGSQEPHESSESSISNDSASEGFDTGGSFQLPLPSLLKRFSEGYERSKRRNEMYKKSIERQRESTSKLNALLATKENDLREAHRKSRKDQISLQAAMDRAEELAEKHQAALQELKTAKEQVAKLKQLDSERKQTLDHSRRRLKIEEKRLSGVRDLIDSLRAAREMDAKRLEFIQEEGGSDDSYNSQTSSHSEAGRPRETIPKTPDLSMDLSVELEMAAMAMARREESSSNSNSSDGTYASVSRLSPDLSAELAAVTAAMAATPDTIGSTRSYKKGTITKNKWDHGANYAKGTPQTLSVNTKSTASDDSGDDSMHTITLSETTTPVPETPLVARHVSIRRREFDRCSPLSAKQLDFTGDEFADA